MKAVKSPSKSRSKPLRVVAVLGTSFSGSTVLNLILGAHSKIYAGGEMIGLLDQRNKLGGGSCTSCGLDCEYWDGIARDKIQKDNFYPLTKSIFGKDIIVDTSKSMDWFTDILASGQNVNVRPVYVLMVKHPIRYLASCMINIGGAKPTGPVSRTLSRFSPAYARKALLTEWIGVLDRYYDGLLRNLPRDAGDADFHILHYERLVENQRKAVTPILASLGLEYESRLDNFYATDFHQIGGNNGAVFQVKKNWNGGDRDVPEFRRKFYEQGPALKIDNKYASTFTPAEVNFLKSNATLRELLERLGYNSPSMPFPV
jgi:hypothetical protein